MVGFCYAQSIDRNRIRDHFWEAMDGRSQELSELATDLFDDRGNLLTDPIQSVTAVWGKELDQGPFLMLDKIKITEERRRQGHGKRLVEDTRNQAQRAMPGFTFAVVLPTNLEAMDSDNGRKFAQEIAQSFWSRMGFRRVATTRWFAKATATAKLGHDLSSTAGYKGPTVPSTDAHRLEEP